jgi:recombinational DNA repair ATPase RecF
VNIRYQLSNYRCFPGEGHADLELVPGLVSLVGVNNAGKSSLLRSLYEFRSLFEMLRSRGPARALAAYERAKDTGFPWSKMRDNPRIAAALTREDLDGTDLGDFLQLVAEGA